MVKIIHTADIHLDSPFSLESFEKSEVRKNELRGTFTSLIMYAKMEKADIMLLCGDIFDSNFVTRDTASLMLKEFTSVPDCRFVIAPGNHDPYDEFSPYKKVDFPDNVYIFSSEAVEKFSFDDIKTDVYGFAFTNSHMTASPDITGLTLDKGKLNILAAHADITNSISQYCPLSESDIEKSGFDYVALGHIHNSRGIEMAGKTYYGYSGTPEGRGFDECGQKTVIIGEFEKEAGVFTPNFKKRAFSGRNFERATLDITGAKTTVDIISKAEELIKDNGYGKETSLKITLEGNVPSTLSISYDLFKKSLNSVFSIELEDNTASLYDYEALKNDPTIRGAFFAQLEPFLKDGTSEEKHMASLALRYGMSVLDGNDVV